MPHYTYKIKFETGHIYYGIRSCKKDPYQDNYFGSPVKYKDYREKYSFKKTILKIYSDEDYAKALDDERFLINWQWNSTDTGKKWSLNAGITYFPNYGKVKIMTSKMLKAREKINEEQCINFFIISPNGQMYEGKNLREFCITKNLQYKTVHGVVKGRCKTWKGWCSNFKDWLEVKYYGNTNKIVPPIKVTHPEHGKDIIYNRRVFGRKWNISSGHVIEFCNGKKECCKGWKKL
jgi:hypothetical protein